MDAAAKSILDYGLAIVATVALAYVVWDAIRDLRKQRDRSQELLDHSLDALDRLADQLQFDVRGHSDRPRGRS